MWRFKFLIALTLILVSPAHAGLRDVRSGLYSINPEFWNQVGRIGAPVKKTFGRYEDWSLSQITSNMEFSKKDDSYCALLAPPTINPTFHESIAVNVKAITDNMKKADLPRYQERANRVLDSVKSYAEDWGMISCYNVEVTEGVTFNSFNTGCKIYITKQTMDLFPDDLHLRAVFAHEIAHGDAGHLVKNFGKLFSSAVPFTVNLLKDEIIYFTKGIIGKTLSPFIGRHEDPIPEADRKLRALYYMSCAGQDYLDGLIKRYADQAVDVEIDADRGGARILEASGNSSEDLVDALTILHDAILEKSLAKVPEDQRGEKRTQLRKIYIDGVDSSDKNEPVFRQYPSLNERIRAIRSQTY